MSLSTQDFLDNLGGINTIIPIKLQYIVTFDKIYYGKINDFTVYTRTPAYFEKTSVKLTHNKIKGSQGKHYNNSIAFVIPKDRIELFSWVLDSDEEEFVVIYIDNNDKIKVLGTLEEPLHFSADLDPGQVEKLNGYKVIFSRKSRTRPYFIDDLPEIIPP